MPIPYESRQKSNPSTYFTKCLKLYQQYLNTVAQLPAVSLIRLNKFTSADLCMPSHFGDIHSTRPIWGMLRLGRMSPYFGEQRGLSGSARKRTKGQLLSHCHTQEFVQPKWQKHKSWESWSQICGERRGKSVCLLVKRKSWKNYSERSTHWLEGSSLATNFYLCSQWRKLRSIMSPRTVGLY